MFYLHKRVNSTSHSQYLIFFLNTLFICSLFEKNYTTCFKLLHEQSQTSISYIQHKNSKLC